MSLFQFKRSGKSRLTTDERIKEIKGGGEESKTVSLLVTGFCFNVPLEQDRETERERYRDTHRQIETERVGDQMEVYINETINNGMRRRKRRKKESNTYLIVIDFSCSNKYLLHTRMTCCMYV